MAKFWAWLKPKLIWIAAGAGAIISLLIAIATLGRSRPIGGGGKPPPRPELEDVPDVKVPDVKTDFETKPADKYEEKKAEPKRNGQDVIDDLNNSFN